MVDTLWKTGQAIPSEIHVGSSVTICSALLALVPITVFGMGSNFSVTSTSSHCSCQLRLLLAQLQISHEQAFQTFFVEYTFV